MIFILKIQKNKKILYLKNIISYIKIYFKLYIITINLKNLNNFK